MQYTSSHVSVYSRLSSLCNTLPSQRRNAIIMFKNKITLQEETFKNENKVSLRVEAKTC